MHALRAADCGPGIKKRPLEAAPIVRQIDRGLDLLQLHKANPARYPHLLQSTANGRYDILFAFPGDSLRLDNEGRLHVPGEKAPKSGDFPGHLDNWWCEARATASAEIDLPFTGGWFVFLGYELAAQIEPSLRLPAASGALPVAIATRFRTAVVVDHHKGTTSIVGEQGQQQSVAQILADTRALPPRQENAVAEVLVEEVHEEAPQQYLDAVARIHDYIHEGDVFQVNLSRLWRIQLEQAVDAAVLYASLGIHNPSPFSGLASWPDAAIISSSPERLVSVHGRTVETRPIAGTRPRSATAARDVGYSDELMSNPKERAEHIMLIDLERNDLGRICVPGSIEVNELMVLESFAHVHHIVSNVRGTLREDVLPGQVIRAVFPGGTITGCPKVRCMEIIAELEQDARGAYTGSMGYINRDGSMDLNILIRSMVYSGNELQLRAGAGIVADSVADAELEETRAKARGLLHALGLHQA
jgi:anthranilate synthase component 1